MADAINIVVRPALKTHENFILSTWLKGNYYGTHFRSMPQNLYYKEYIGHLWKIILMPGIKINVACDEQNPSWVVGFSVFKDEILYWIHVKKDYRNKGLATHLLKDAKITTVKALTKVGRAIAESKGLIFNPL